MPSDDAEALRQQIEALKQRVRALESENVQLKAIIAASGASRGGYDESKTPMSTFGGHVIVPSIGSIGVPPGGRHQHRTSVSFLGAQGVSSHVPVQTPQRFAPSLLRFPPFFTRVQVVAFVFADSSCA
jgi:hypothetical protein